MAEFDVEPETRETGGSRRRAVHDSVDHGHRLALVVFGSLLLVGTFSLAISGAYAFKRGDTAYLAVMVACWLVFAAATFLKPLPLALRAWAGIAVIYVVGVGVQLLMGLPSSGRIWLFAAPIVAAVLLGVIPAMLTTLVNILLLTGLGAAMALDWLPWPPDFVHGPESWAVASVTFLTVSTGVTMALAMLLKRLRDALKTQKRLNDELRQERGSLHQAYLKLARETGQRVEAQQVADLSRSQKQALLKEVHHRVKNNLQLMSSLLSLQAQRADDVLYSELFQESQNRIRSMALVHEELYASDDVSRVDLGSYATKLGAKLQSIMAPVQDIDITVKSRNVELSVDQAVPVGMILNELISNAIRHGFPQRARGQVAVVASQEGDTIRIMVADNGQGLPEQVSMDDPQTLGFKVVMNLVQQLKGVVELQRGKGTRISIRFLKTD
jgi:two-component sensor histidine kinase